MVVHMLQESFTHSHQIAINAQIMCNLACHNVPNVKLFGSYQFSWRPQRSIPNQSLDNQVLTDQVLMGADQ
jgi:hypothetical protein